MNVVAVQLDFWKSDEDCEMEAMRKAVAKCESTATSVRKAMFARHGEMQKKMWELEERLALIERNICKG